MLTVNGFMAAALRTRLNDVLVCACAVNALMASHQLGAGVAGLAGLTMAALGRCHKVVVSETIHILWFMHTYIHTYIHTSRINQFDGLSAGH